MGIADGKRALIVGVANDKSLAWAIAQELRAQGAEIALTYQGDMLEKRVRPLAESIRALVVGELDVTNDIQIGLTMSELRELWGGLDMLVHAVAFADREDLRDRFLTVSRGNFAKALEISAYSLVALARAAEPLMEARGGGSILTMTYLGGERAVPHYNVMGVAKATLDSSVRYLAWDLGRKNIRVNAVSAGPVRTLAARSIAGFPTMESIVEERSPLHRPIDADDVGAAGAYLLSDDAHNVTATTLYVDSGYHSMGM
jgi:enoyl-[acyl-carrier protein] reductase I